ncbi:NADPH-dependent FMN reductase [Peptostreptococcus faecalis]|uniref:NADPH-dependent FMN reductase n=1 Tax=Peptostreptococcus faecalis TaxID=2045015 RepID=UPI000C79CB96|nr:NADPH-dependent FMN reductase [Peptostreptococcus faecalis]
MLNIGILVGSLRKESYNMKIAKYIVDKYPEKANFEIVEIRDFPLFNSDLEEDVPESVLRAKSIIKDKDGIIIVSPEYNHSIPGVLKNALDWFSRGEYVMMRKPYMIMGASMGSIGTARMQGHLRQVLNSPSFKMYSISENEFLYASIQKNIDEKGKLTNERTIAKLDKKIDDFLKFTKVVKEEL